MYGFCYLALDLVQVSPPHTVVYTTRGLFYRFSTQSCLRLVPFAFVFTLLARLAPHLVHTHHLFAYSRFFCPILFLSLLFATMPTHTTPGSHLDSVHILMHYFTHTHCHLHHAILLVTHVPYICLLHTHTHTVLPRFIATYTLFSLWTAGSFAHADIFFLPAVRHWTPRYGFTRTPRLRTPHRTRTILCVATRRTHGSFTLRFTRTTFAVGLFPVLHHYRTHGFRTQVGLHTHFWFAFVTFPFSFATPAVAGLFRTFYARCIYTLVYTFFGYRTYTCGHAHTRTSRTPLTTSPHSALHRDTHVWVLGSRLAGRLVFTFTHVALHTSPRFHAPPLHTRTYTHKHRSFASFGSPALHTGFTPRIHGLPRTAPVSRLVSCHYTSSPHTTARYRHSHTLPGCRTLRSLPVPAVSHRFTYRHTVLHGSCVLH